MAKAKRIPEWDSTNEFEFGHNSTPLPLVYKPKPTQPTMSIFSTSSSADVGLPTIHERQNTRMPTTIRKRAVGSPFSKEEPRVMMKDELLTYSTQPKWIYTRTILLVLFFIGYLILVIVAISLLFKHPSCSSYPWYQVGVGYQILPRSFRDSDGDGIGDLKGITEKLSYLKYIGVSIIWLGSVAQTPYKDLGYDVSNFVSVDTVIGTANDFADLIKEANKQEIKVILELVPNHSSDEHAWFVESRQSKDTEFSDYYVWADGVNGNPPNNWISVYGGSAWSYTAERNQWYLHTFSEHEPDLNYRNSMVEKEMTDVLRYWLTMGVDGLFLRHVNSIFETTDLDLNEPVNLEFMTYDNETQIFKSYDKLTHIYTRDQPGVHQLLATWRDVMDGYSVENGDGNDIYKLLVVDVDGSDVLETVKYFTTNGKREADYPFNYALYQLINGNDIIGEIQEWLSAKPDDSLTSWSIGSSNYHRIASSHNYVTKAMLTLLLTLPGSPILYYGDEIGMTDIQMSYVSRDPRILLTNNQSSEHITHQLSRDAGRSPMQWSPSLHAGFSEVPNLSSLWLPINADYVTVNSEVRNTTYLQCLKDLGSLRSQPAFQSNQLEILRSQKDVITYARREVDDYSTAFFVAINLADFRIQDRYYLHDTDLFGEPEIGTIVFNTVGNNIGSSIDIRNLTLEAGQAIIVEFL